MGRSVSTDQSHAIIVQAITFDPVAFLGKGWIIEEQDERSLALTEIDLSKVQLETCLQEGEASIQGEDKLKRLKQAGHIRLDARFFMGLWKNPKLIPDAWKGKIIYFDGTVLRRQSGSRHVLYLYWGGRQWHWNYGWLGCQWNAVEPSAVLASSTLILEPKA